MNEVELKRDVIPRLPDVTSLSETLYLIYFTALYSASEKVYGKEDTEKLITDFTKVAEILREKFASSARITVPLEVFYPYPSLYATSLNDIFRLQTPYPIKYQPRYSHTWICGHTGSGKTTLLENLIEADLTDVKAGKCGVVVVDSEGAHEILGRIKSWRILDNIPYKIIDSTTPMNPFMAGRAHVHSEMTMEAFETNALEMITYIFNTVNGEGLHFTDKQRGCFRYCVQLLLRVPNASVLDLLHLVGKDGLEPYRQYIPKLSPQAQFFFNTQFDAGQSGKGNKQVGSYGDTKQEIAVRINTLLERPAVRRMLVSNSAFDFYLELSKPQLILVDTDKRVLGKEGTAIMGRYVIAQMLFAANQRADLPESARLPVFTYVDECAHYIKDDPNIEEIIDGCRKMKIGFTFAHQREAHIKSAGVLDALRNTEIQFLPIHSFYWTMSIRNLPPVTIYSPKEEREKRARKPEPARVSMPVLEGEIVPPSRPTSQDNRAIPGPRKWDKDEME